MAIKKRAGRLAEKLAVEAEPGLTTTQLMVRTSSRLVPAGAAALPLSAWLG